MQPLQATPVAVDEGPLTVASEDVLIRGSAVVVASHIDRRTARLFGYRLQIHV